MGYLTNFFQNIEAQYSVEPTFRLPNQMIPFHAKKLMKHHICKFKLQIPPTIIRITFLPTLSYYKSLSNIYNQVPKVSFLQPPTHR